MSLTQAAMNMKSSLNQILPFTCPSIHYRLRKELRFQSPDSPEMADTQSRIFQDENVQEIINSQQPDGWLGRAFHGYNSMESGIRFLCEKGVDPTQPILARALNSLEQHTDRLELGLGNVGKILDDLGFGGSETIRAHLFAQAGNEEISFVKKQIEQALEVFKAIFEIKSVEDLCEPYKGNFVFRCGVRWPSIYHLRLLALTQSWRTTENRNTVVEGIQQIVHLSPIPNIHVKYKSQQIAPACFCMDNFKPDMNALTDAEWMQWFHRMELLARLGIVEQIPELKRQTQTLEHILAEGQEMFTKRLSHPYFQKWGAYTGLALEKDWRLSQRRINDLTFRSLLILHYAGQTL